GGLTAPLQSPTRTVLGGLVQRHLAVWRQLCWGERAGRLAVPGLSSTKAHAAHLLPPTMATPCLTVDGWTRSPLIEYYIVEEQQVRRHGRYHLSLE
ncbi:hypothetical protein CTA1_5642, partial [Colletotrichum tanaceti]